MNGAKLMHVIGDISDKYIMEFSDITPKKAKSRKIAPLVAACLVLVVCAATAIPTVVDYYSDEKSFADKGNNSSSSNEGGDSDAPIHFYLNGKTFIADPSMKITTDVPEEFHYIGTITNIGDTFSGNDFEGNVSGDVYISDDGMSAYVQASSLEKINGDYPFVLCIVENKER